MQVEPVRKAAAADTRFIFVTASLPQVVYLQLKQDFPGIVPIVGPGEVPFAQEGPGTFKAEWQSNACCRSPLTC